MIRGLLLTAFLTVPAACRDDAASLPAPVPLTEDSASYFCQMTVLEHGGPKAQIHLDGQPAPLFFAQVRDALAYLRSPERDARIRATYVSDMGSAKSWDAGGRGDWVAAEGALFVIGAGVAGGMGAPEIVPFAGAVAAQAFVSAHGGRIVGLGQIPDAAVLGPVDPDIRLEVPK